MLCGRDWIEDHLNYERRHHITDKEVESAAEFRRQNAKDCQAEGNGFQNFHITINYY